MKKTLWRDASGATAIEMALLLPALLSLAFGAMAFGVGFWTKNVLQSAAQEAARCIAINGSACSAVPTGCDSTSASVCYVETVSKKRGFTRLAAAEISVNPTATTAGVSFTTVTITHSFSLLKYSTIMVAKGSFPN